MSVALRHLAVLPTPSRTRLPTSCTHPTAGPQGLESQGFYSNCVVPIIENTARECELTDRLREAMAR